MESGTGRAAIEKQPRIKTLKCTTFAGYVESRCCVAFACSAFADLGKLVHSDEAGTGIVFEQRGCRTAYFHSISVAVAAHAETLPHRSAQVLEGTGSDGCIRKPY